MNNVIPYLQTLIITCPHCEGKQTMEFASSSLLWYPIPPFCCEVMGIADGVEWNKKLDIALKKARKTQCH